ncbi:glycosyltransferase family 4 protein [Serratia marcescens]|uniref:glycosyltransferase family 4 protein n=1 Tax=Serratia marcescens TaxID=615 RepID=UPI001BD20EF3|nr:glycosyltransferase family 4 protein [Serratia marcescens]
MSKIAFLLWSPDISGGTNVIFEHATRMRKNGDDITIITEDKPNNKRLEWFPGAEKLTWMDYAEAAEKKFDLVIATWWRTVFYLNKINAKKYAFFVQSIESRFYPEDEVTLRTLVDLTYSLHVNFITEATWIKEYLKEHFDQDALLVRNGISKAYFNDEIKPKVPRASEKLRVLVEGPLNVSFKNTELAVELCRQSRADEVWFVTSTEIGAYPNVDRLFSRVPISEIGSIYASCDVLVKLSTVEGMFGPPLEIYHTGGTSISYDVTGYDEYIEFNVNGLVSFSRQNQEIIEFINRLKDNPDELAQLKANALATAEKWPDWESSSKEFSAACEQLIASGVITSVTLLKAQTERFWLFYEESLRQAQQGGQAGIPSLNRYAHFRQRVINKLHRDYPTIFSLLRKLKWTVKSYLPGAR